MIVKARTDALTGKRFRVLALSGGGYLGVYTAALLAALEDRAGEPLGRRFDLIAGTSVGGILAALVARQTSGRGQRVDVPMFETMVGFVLGDHLGGLSFEPPLDAGAVKLMAALPLSGVAVSMTGAPGTAQLAGSTRQPKSASAPT